MPPLCTLLNRFDMCVVFTGRRARNRPGTSFVKPVILLAAALALAAPAFAQGAQSSSSIDTDVADLKPGQFIWNGDLAPEAR